MQLTKSIGIFPTGINLVVCACVRAHRIQVIDELFKLFKDCQIMGKFLLNFDLIFSSRKKNPMISNAHRISTRFKLTTNKFYICNSTPIVVRIE